MGSRRLSADAIRWWLAASVLACGGGESDPTSRMGDVELTTRDDALALAGVTRIAGSLILRGGPELSGELSLPDLEEVGGGVVVTGAALTAFAAPALAYAERVFVDGAALERLALPALREVDVVDLREAEALTGLELDALTEAREVHVAPGLMELELPSLVELDVLTTDFAEVALRAVRAPKLERCAEIRLRGAERLERLDLPALTAIDTELMVRSEDLAELSLASLLYVAELHVLLSSTTRVELSHLEQAGSLFFSLRGDADLGLHALRQVNRLNVLPTGTGDVGILHVTLPSLERASDLSLNALAGELSLPALTEIGQLHASGDDLESVAAPRLASVGVLGLSGDGLASLEFPALETAGQIRIDGSQLPCDLGKLFPSLSEPEAAVLSVPERCP
jgi:hypothetical protein